MKRLFLFLSLVSQFALAAGPVLYTAQPPLVLSGTQFGVSQTLPFQVMTLQTQATPANPSSVNYLKLYFKNDGGLYSLNSSGIETLIGGTTGSGITSLNGLTASTQTFANGSSGTAPAFVSSISTHTLNIPMAATSGVTAGLISKAQYDVFNGKQNALTFGNLTSATTGVTITGGTSSVIGSGTSISIQTASSLQPGLLSAADWTTFNSKQSALTIGNLTSATTGVSITGGTSAVIGSGTSISIQTASGSQPGLLSSADWTTFNNKAPTASPIFSGTVTLPSGYVSGSVWNTGSSQVELGGFTVLRYDNNGPVFLQIRNESTGASALSKLALSSDVGNFNMLASSVAGGSLVQMLADSAFTGGFQIGTIGAGPFQVFTNNTQRLSISSAGVVTIPGQVVASNVTDSSSTTTGSLLTSGGLGVAKNAYIGGNLNLTGTATFGSTITTPLTASRALISNGSSQLAVSATTSTELGYVSGVTSAIQTQLDNKAPAFAEFDAGNSGTSKTIDWTNGVAQKITLTGNVTFTFTAPSKTGSPLVLRVLTGAGSFTATWPASVKWTSTPTVTTTASRMDLFNFYYDGTNYYGSYSQNYTP